MWDFGISKQPWLRSLLVRLALMAVRSLCECIRRLALCQKATCTYYYVNVCASQVSYLLFRRYSILTWTRSCFGDAILRTILKSLICAPRSEERSSRSDEQGLTSVSLIIAPRWSQKSLTSTIGYKNSTYTAGAFEWDSGEAIQV